MEGVKVTLQFCWIGLKGIHFSFLKKNNIGLPKPLAHLFPKFSTGYHPRVRITLENIMLHCMIRLANKHNINLTASICDLKL